MECSISSHRASRLNDRVPVPGPTVPMCKSRAHRVGDDLVNSNISFPSLP